ncbi:hypothetical protein GGR56DRAFT_617996 [Xylariaceae sp. FL0804]|nr:hypothetical protein GGR56DRAFT_617996 [Xylariaceae sp. FL0804]
MTRSLRRTGPGTVMVQVMMEMAGWKTPSSTTPPPASRSPPLPLSPRLPRVRSSRDRNSRRQTAPRHWPGRRCFGRSAACSSRRPGPAAGLAPAPARPLPLRRPPRLPPPPGRRRASTPARGTAARRCGGRSRTPTTGTTRTGTSGPAAITSTSTRLRRTSAARCCRRGRTHTDHARSLASAAAATAMA